MRTSTIKPRIETQLQNGFTRIELMISIVIGLFILSAVLSLFVSMIKSDADNAKAIQLNHQLRTVMSLMTRDIRRAGANRTAAANSLASPPRNPFSAAGTTRLLIDDNAQGDAESCITYSYDSDEISELYGFRLDSVNNAVETRASGKNCGDPVVAIVMMIVAPIAAMLVQMAISRTREFEADKGGAQIAGNPFGLVNALQKLEQGAQVVPMHDAKPATAHMFIVNPLTGGGLMKLFSTHPPVADRVKRLREMTRG